MKELENLVFYFSILTSVIEISIKSPLVYNLELKLSPLAAIASNYKFGIL